MKVKNNTIIFENEPIVKPKRGRKSKQELIASLSITSFVTNIQPLTNSVITTSSVVSSLDNKPIKLSVNELGENEISVTDINQSEKDNKNHINEQVNDILNNTNSIYSVGLTEKENEKEKYVEAKPPIKKRGRKPKGGKIINQVLPNQNEIKDKPNVILHLKCSLKDLHLNGQNNYLLESYNYSINNKDIDYNIIGNETSNNFYNESNTLSVFNLENDNDRENSIYKDSEEYDDTNKDIWKKLKQLEHNLHINCVNNKKSACFWDTCEFDNPPIYIPKHYINGTYHVYGCFCSPECGVAYLMNESIDSSTKFERYHLFNHIYSKIYDYKKNIKPSPNPYYMLEKYYGNLSIQEYRSLLRNERLFLIIDKPLTRILPELHEDNDDFILNNKIIPSNYQIKTKLQKKKQNKNHILNEKFGVTSQNTME